jgi:hypothetical protein
VRNLGGIGGQRRLLSRLLQREQRIAEHAAELAETGFIGERQPFAVFDPRPQGREAAVGEDVERDQHIGVEHHAFRGG